MKVVTLNIPVEFDGTRTDADAVAHMLDRLLVTAWELAGKDVEEDYGPIRVGAFSVNEESIAEAEPPREIDEDVLQSILAWSRSRDGSAEADERALREIQEMTEEALGLPPSNESEEDGDD